MILMTYDRSGERRDDYGIFHSKLIADLNRILVALCSGLLSINYCSVPHVCPEFILDLELLVRRFTCARRVVSGNSH